MKDISNYLTDAQAKLVEADKLIAHATMTDQQIKQLRTTLILARSRLDDSIAWVRDREAY